MSTTEQCPIIDYNPFLIEPVHGHVKAVDELQAKFRHIRTEPLGASFHVFLKADDIRDALQDPGLWSSRAVTPLDPNPPYLWIPEMLDPPKHTKWRQLLSPHFAPGPMTAMEAEVRARAAELVAPLAAKGSCDFLNDFAWQYPTSIFMKIFGMPMDDFDQFMTWEAAILHTPPDLDPDRSKAVEAMMAVQSYFAELLKKKSEEPGDDLLTECLTWRIDGEPIPQDDLLAFCLLMMMAGLDTVSIQLAYSFHHLATHPEDRERIVREPSIIPSAVEEFLRAYAFVAPGRTATRDTVHNGVEIKAGEMVFLPLCAATRDPDQFENAKRVDIARAVNNHAAFGLGPHRCLGSHLARRELRFAIEEWHKVIPNYRLADNQDVLEHGGMFGIDNLSLVWD
ncbi:MAG: cytochrome P450 [Acidimicrobiia bacterium]